jgi:hypothetical protein
MVEKNGSDKYLSLEDIANAADEEYREIAIKEWGQNGQPGVLLISTISAADMIEWSEENDGPARKNAALRLITKAYRKPDKTRLTDAEQGKLLNLLKSKSSKTCSFIVREILELNGLATRKTEELIKNDFGEAAGGVSPTNVH